MISHNGANYGQWDWPGLFTLSGGAGRLLTTGRGLTPITPGGMYPSSRRIQREASITVSAAAHSAGCDQTHNTGGGTLTLLGILTSSSVSTWRESMTHYQRPLLDERGLHLTTVRGASQMRGVCPGCGKPDKPLHRLSQHEYYCATCLRKIRVRSTGGKC